VTRFVLLSTQRSGSTWVVDMLNSHPRVVAYTELFIHGASTRTKWAGEKDVDFWQVVLKQAGPPRSRLKRTRLLWRYLGQVYRDRPGVDAVGFKLMYSQLRVSKPLVPALVLRRVRIVHLIRRNALDVVLSKEAGAARGSLHAPAGEEVRTVTVHLPTANLLERLAAHEQDVERAQARFRRLRLPSLEVAYEDLVRDEQRGFAEIFDFLGVGETDALSSSLQKLNPTSHAQVIENYDEVRELLTGTRFEPQLH
jgi:LPS sulfotransferase NodH